MRSLATLFFQNCLARIVKLADGFWDQVDLNMKREVGQERCAGIERENGRPKRSGECLPDNQQQFSADLNRIWCTSNRFQKTYVRKHSRRKIKKVV